MLKKVFIILAILGIIIISILSFVLPKDPFMIVPALSIVSFDKPLWLCYIIGISFVYLLILYSIYDFIKQKNVRN